MPESAVSISPSTAHEPAARTDVGRRYAAAAVQTGIGGIVSRALQGFAPIILARYLGPKDYGVYVLMLSLVGIVAGASPLGQDTALEKFLPEYSIKNPARGGAILANTVVLFSGVLAILCAAFFFAAHWLASGVYHDASLTRVFQFSALLVLALSLFNLAYSVSAGLQDFRNYSRAMIVRSGALTLFGWLGVLFLGLYGALLGQLAASLLGLSLLTITAVKLSRRRFPDSLRPIFSQDILREVFSFAFAAFLTTLVGAPVYWWVNTMLARHQGFAQVGLFGVALTLAQVVLLLPVSLSFPGVSFMSELHATADRSVFGSFLVTHLRLAWALTLPLALGLGLFSPLLVRILFGSAFAGASLAGTMMSGAALLMVVNAFINIPIAASGRMWQAFGMTLGWALLFILFGLLFIPAWGAVGAATTFLFSYLAFLAIEFTYCWHAFGTSFKNFARLAVISAGGFLITIGIAVRLSGFIYCAIALLVFAGTVTLDWMWATDPSTRRMVRGGIVQMLEAIGDMLRLKASPFLHVDEVTAGSK
ncbi:MAG: oligosaccharide flippase family protein [Terriglobia bacterium]